MPLHRKNAKGSRKVSVNAFKKLTSIHRLGALAITGVLRTFLTDALDASAALLPMEYEIKKACFKAITHMATLPAKHPLYVLVKRCAKRHVKRLRSLIHILTAIFRLDSTKIKKILAVHTHPKDRGSPPVHLDIPSNKDPQKGLMLQQLSESGFIQMDLLMEGKSVPQQS